MNTSALVRRLATVGAAIVLAGALVSAQAQDSLELRVRNLYASAEYDQALSAIGDSQDPAAQQYRALCLLALGRQADAEAALERLIASAPEFTLSAEDMPPRFVALFAQQRREIVPGVVRKLFAEAREDYRAKAYDRALPQFKKVLALSSDAEVRDVEGLDDLRLLAESFIDIATASESPKPDGDRFRSAGRCARGTCTGASADVASRDQAGDATVAIRYPGAHGAVRQRADQNQQQRTGHIGDDGSDHRAAIRRARTGGDAFLGVQTRDRQRCSGRSRIDRRDHHQPDALISRPT